MSSKEHSPTPENQPTPYVNVTRFSGEKPAGRAYRRAQDLLFRTPDCELSAFRFHLNRIWHVAVLGDQPSEDLDRQLRLILSHGQPISLLEQVLAQLQQRRAQRLIYGGCSLLQGRALTSEDALKQLASIGKEMPPVGNLDGVRSTLACAVIKLTTVCSGEKQ